MKTIIPFVAALAVAVAAALLASWGSVFALGRATNLAAGPALDLYVGRRIFVKRCMSCHTLRKEEGSFGPNLHAIGRHAANRIPGMPAHEYIYRSIVTPSAFRVPGHEESMPEAVADGLTPEELTGLVGYLSNQGATFDKLAVRNLYRRIPPPKHDAAPPTEKLSLAQIELGRSLFFGKFGCAQCHGQKASVADHRAPNLSAIGYEPTEKLRESILEPSKKIRQDYAAWTVLDGGRAITGRRLPAPKGRLRLLAPTNESAQMRFHDWSLTDLEAESDGEPVSAESPVSPMPPYGGKMTPEEFDALLAFLKVLR